MTDFQGHSGFLNGAQALDSIVSVEISIHIDKYPRGQCILFTGHSAGDAVASLLYLRHLRKSISSMSSPSSKTGFTTKRLGPESTTRFSCITYGAPPSLTTPFVPPKPSANEVCINIINKAILSLEWMNHMFHV